jgi:hypothetical protein
MNSCVTSVSFRSCPTLQGFIARKTGAPHTKCVSSLLKEPGHDGGGDGNAQGWTNGEDVRL